MYFHRSLTARHFFETSFSGSPFPNSCGRYLQKSALSLGTGQMLSWRTADIRGFELQAHLRTSHTGQHRVHDVPRCGRERESFLALRKMKLHRSRRRHEASRDICTFLFTAEVRSKRPRRTLVREKRRNTAMRSLEVIYRRLPTGNSRHIRNQPIFCLSRERGKRYQLCSNRR